MSKRFVVALLAVLVGVGAGVACKKNPPKPPQHPPVTQPPSTPTPEPPPEATPPPEEPTACPIDEKLANGEADIHGCVPCAKPSTCKEGWFRDHGRCCPDGALDPPPPPNDGPGDGPGDGEPTPTPPPPPPPGCEIPEWSRCNDHDYRNDALCHPKGHGRFEHLELRCGSPAHCEHLRHGDKPCNPRERD